MNKISRINLKNNSATICSLECYYKENNEASPKRIGGTGTFTAGKALVNYTVANLTL